jgi:hypothetical protein
VESGDAQLQYDAGVALSTADDVGSSPADGERLLPALAFWFCLACSAAILAIVFLSPRLRTYRDLKRQYNGLDRELIASEGDVDYLHRVVDALRHDPEFAAELARADFSISGSEERIAVAPALRLGGIRKPLEPVTLDTARPIPQNVLDTPLLDSLSDNRSVRTSLLGAASLLVLVAFAMLCEKRPGLEPVESSRWGERCRGWLADRYSRVPD